MKNQMSKIRLSPQKGPQEKFLATTADICVYGGAAGGGKTYGLLLEPLRHKNNKGFTAVIFRKAYTQVTAPGGLWDASRKVYSPVKGSYSLKTPKLHWTFSSGASVNFAHLSRDDECEDWQGSEITMIGFDELTHFSEYQFFYMLSRNRSTCGVRPYIRATCNPDSDSWVAKFISWWIDQETGYPIAERSGVIRWMTRVNEEIVWFNTKKEGFKYYEDRGISRKRAAKKLKSVTFIASKLQDNKILMEKDPGYLSNLEALSVVEKERLLNGNWKIKAAAGLFFKRSEVEMIEDIPNDVVRWVRAWDLAATAENENGNSEPAATAGVLMGKRKNGNYVIADVTNVRLRADDVRKHIKNTAIIDKKKYKTCTIRLPQDPGQAGKDQARSYIKMLAGFSVKAIPESGSKESRADPFSAQWQHGNVEVLAAEWNEMYFSQLESFPESKFKDMVDATSSAFAELESGNTITAPSSGPATKDSYWT